jgi:hypothetical protein
VASETTQPPDDDHHRIDELESQIRELSGLVEILLSRPENQTPAELPAARRGLMRRRAPSAALARPLVGGVRDAVGRAIGGVEGESFESRVGGIWLGRIVAVLFMTLFVLGALITVQDERLGAAWKIGVGYAIAAGTIAYGISKRRDESLFPQTVLGSGLAALYFTTYAAFFLETTRLVDSPRVGIGVLAAVLVIVAAVAHFRRSETAAGIALFLIYYTVVLSLANSLTEDNIVYALITCTSVAVIALAFHLTHRWLFFTWAALIATQITYIYFFQVQPPALDVSDEKYFWVSNAFLTLIFCVFSIACVTDARRSGEYRRTVAPMAAVNSFVYLTLTWIAVRGRYPEYEWAFRFGQTSMFLSLAAYAHFAGQPRNYLFQLFAAKTFIVFTLALQSYLSHEWLLVAMSIECLGLGLSYLRSGLVIFKVFGQGLLLITLAGCLLSIPSASEVQVLGYVLPARWFSSVGAAFVWCIVAWFYHHYVQRLPAERRTLKGQWFLADSWLDASGWAMALLHACAAALVLMAITILDLGSDPRMPFLLAGEGILMALVGVILATPQVEVASVLLLIASHACYHSFLILNVPGFETQSFFVTYAFSVALLTFIGGYLWERYLNRIQGGTQWEHDAMASIPFMAAVLMLFTLAERRLDASISAIGGLGLAACMLYGGSVTRLAGLRFGGVLTLGLASWSYTRYLLDPARELHGNRAILSGLVAALLFYAAAERACLAWERKYGRQGPWAGLLRSGVVIVAAMVGLVGLWRWAPERSLTLYWLGLTVGAMALGLVFWERRYRWAALVMYMGFVVGRAMLHDLRNLELIPRFLSIGALTVPGLLIFWGYSEYRSRHLRRLREQKALRETGGGHSTQDAPQS